MSKVKVNAITAIGLLLTLVIGVISYGCTSNKNLNSPTATTVKNTNQTTISSQSNSDSKSIQNQEINSRELNTSTTSPNRDNSSLSALESRDPNLVNLSNNSRNRLRPEILRILQSKFSNDSELQTALNGASILQDYLDRPNQDAVTMIKRYDCSVISLTQADQNLIQSLTFDTAERKNKIKNGLKDYQPAVSIEIQIDNQGNAISPCSNIR